MLRRAWLALASAVLFGASAPLAKLLLRDVSPQLMAGLLYLGSGGGLAIIYLFHRGEEERPQRRVLPWLAGAVVCGGMIAPVLLLSGLARTPASGASLLLNLEGVFTALIAWFVFHENVDKRIALGMAAIVAGGAVLAWEGHASWGGAWGPLLIAAACLAWAADNNLTQRVSAGDPRFIAMVKGLVAGTVNTAIALGLHAGLPSGSRVAGALLVGFVSYGVSLVLFVLALRNLGTARTGAYFSTAPFIGAALSLLIFPERPVPAFLIAGILMGFGVWLHLTEHHEHEHRHEEMDHAHAHVHDEHHQHEHTPDDPPMTDPRPHTHRHRHAPVTHTHPHVPDIHHRHRH